MLCEYFMNIELVRDRLIGYQKLFRQELEESETQRIENLISKIDRCTMAIAVFGKVSTGKTSLVNALLGDRLGATGAINGVTQDVITYDWQPTSKKINLQLIDTQGIDEIDGAIRAAIALDAAKQADLILFVIAGAMTRLEQEAIAQLQRCAKPILLVFNKTDLYTDLDRQVIHQSLQSAELQKLISPSEIILTVAEPQPLRVRVQYADHQDRQEIWEKPKPDVQTLKSRILDLLNLEGKSLISVNVLRSLLEIQRAVIARYMQKMAWRSIVAPLFLVQAIALLCSPWQWLDAAIAGSISSILGLSLVNKYPIQKGYIWLLLILGIAVLSGLMGSDRGADWLITAQNLAEILITAIGLSMLAHGILRDIAATTTSGKFSAENSISEIINTTPTNSILRRLDTARSID